MSPVAEGTADKPMRPICFMIMPYGTKDTQAPAGRGPARVDFDALWRLAFAPAIDTLGYEAIRADQDLGALIIQEMLERLALSDLVGKVVVLRRTLPRLIELLERIEFGDHVTFRHPCAVGNDPRERHPE